MFNGTLKIYGLCTAMVFTLATGPLEAITAESALGPTLAKRGEKVLLYFRGNGTDNRIYEAVYQNSAWQSPTVVRDLPGTSTAFTSYAPLAFHTVEDNHGGWENNIRLFFRGHNNGYVWFATWKRLRPGGPLGWTTPRHLPVASQAYGVPGAVLHMHDSIENRNLYVAYRKTGGHIAYRVQQGSGWSREYAPVGLNSSHGPTLASFKGHLYIFFRHPSSQRLYVARKNNSLISDSTFDVRMIPGAFTRQGQGRVVDVVEHRRQLMLAFSGHNNDFVWLKRADANSTGTLSFEHLGYVPGIATQRSVALQSVHEGPADFPNRLYVAFRSKNSAEICVGKVVLRDRNNHDFFSVRRDRPELDCGD